MVDKKDIERFWELERKMDEGKATESELYERDALWTMLQLEEDESNIHLYQFGC